LGSKNVTNFTKLPNIWRARLAYLYLKVHGHGQIHSRNFCRFKLDI